MKKIALLAAVAASAMVATPVMAGTMKHSNSNAEMHSSKAMHHAKTKKMKQSRAMQSGRMAVNAQRAGAWDNDDSDADWGPRADASWNRGTDTGFVPLDVATGVTAGAIGTAGAIAGSAVGTAGAIAAAPFEPFRNDWLRRDRDSYAYYNGPVNTMNGPTCQPGTWTTINGMKMRCQ